MPSVAIFPMVVLWVFMQYYEYPSGNEMVLEGMKNNSRAI